MAQLQPHECEHHSAIARSDRQRRSTRINTKCRSFLLPGLAITQSTSELEIEALMTHLVRRFKREFAQDTANCTVTKPDLIGTTPDQFVQRLDTWAFAFGINVKRIQ